MKALILAAGRGTRLGAISDKTPKPLIPVGGQPLITYLLRSLARHGFTDLVINLGHLREQIVDILGDGSQFGVRITYSPEPEGALETGGGIQHALPLLGSDPFLVANGDVWSDFPFSELPKTISGLAHLVMVDNPGFHPEGDFVLDENNLLQLDGTSGRKLTYSGIGIYRHALFENCEPGRFRLAPLLKEAMQSQSISGEYFGGQWHDCGTPERVDTLDKLLSQPKKLRIS